MIASNKPHELHSTCDGDFPLDTKYILHHCMLVKNNTRPPPNQASSLSPYIPPAEIDYSERTLFKSSIKSRHH